MIYRTLLLVINPINGYFSESGSCKVTDRGYSDIKKAVVGAGESVRILSTREVRSQDDPYWSHSDGMFSIGSADLQAPEFIRAHMQVSNSRYDAMHKTILLSELKKSNPEEIYVIGAETHKSVLLTSISLSNFGFNVKVVEPLCYSRNKYLHNSSITLLADELNIEVVGGLPWI